MQYEFLDSNLNFHYKQIYKWTWLLVSKKKKRYSFISHITTNNHKIKMIKIYSIKYCGKKNCTIKEKEIMNWRKALINLNIDITYFCVCSVVDCQNLATTRGIFPQVTNNHSTCHQPRLTPQYMDLQDLKFRVCDSGSVQVYFT